MMNKQDTEKEGWKMRKETKYLKSLLLTVGLTDRQGKTSVTSKKGIAWAFTVSPSNEQLEKLLGDRHLLIHDHPEQNFAIFTW